MPRQIVHAALAIALCLTVSFAQGAPRGRGGAKPHGGGGAPGGNRAAHAPSGGARGAGARGGSNAPGGAWSPRTHQGNQLAGPGGGPGHSAGAAAAGRFGGAGNNRAGQAFGEQSAAAGAFAANRRGSQASGEQDAAAGAAAANRRAPQATGAPGAAAGAYAANRNAPQASGAEGAAAGAYAANRNTPPASGAEGAAFGAAAASRRAPAMSGADGAALGIAGVRNSFRNPNIYGRQWFGAHPGAWAPSRWAAGAAWAPATWGAVAGYCGYEGATPISYNYGVNVTYEDGDVAIDGQDVGTAEEFSQQASDLAASGAAAETPADEEWMPLGVFAMVRNELQHPQLIVQLAVDKQGVLRGNYTDELTEHTLPIHGAVDKETQRAAWTVGGNTQTVMEAGISNLTEDAVPALIHKNGQTDHWLLVRLEQPAAAPGAAGGSATDAGPPQQ